MLLLLISGLDQVLSVGADSLSVEIKFHHERLYLAHISSLVEVVSQSLLALDSTVCDLANLLGVEGLPSLAVHVLEEGYDVDWVDKVDEGVADVAAVVHVHGQVEEVVLALMESVDSLEEHILGVLVGDITNHDGCARVLTGEDLLKVNGELRVGVLAARGGTLRASSWYIAGHKSVGVVGHVAIERLHVAQELALHGSEASLIAVVLRRHIEGLRLLEGILGDCNSRVVGIEVNEGALGEEFEGSRLDVGETTVTSLSWIELIKVKGHHIIGLLEVRSFAAAEF